MAAKSLKPFPMMHREAAIFFEEKMTAPTKDRTLFKWFYVIDNAIITTFLLSGESAKLTATQIFAFQNDRGLGLTTLEKLKAFLMHQIYRNTTTNALSNIHSLEAKFAFTVPHFFQAMILH